MNAGCEEDVKDGIILVFWGEDVSVFRPAVNLF